MLEYLRKPDAKWRKLRINKKFFDLLQDNFPNGVTNLEAYGLYEEHCAEYRKKMPREQEVRELLERGFDTEQINYVRRSVDFDDWLTMNVRNQLSALAYHGYLERIEPGVYRWAHDTNDPASLDDINDTVRFNQKQRVYFDPEARRFYEVVEE